VKLERQEVPATSAGASDRRGDAGGSERDKHGPALARMYGLPERPGRSQAFDRGSDAHDEDDDSVEPRLLVPENRTPLPDVDRAMPFLSLFPAVIGRRRGRYKVALLKTLQTDGAGRWKIRNIQDAVFWLEPVVVAELVRELRDSGVLAYDANRMTYRMTPSGRVVSSLATALTMPTVEPRRLIKYLSLAMSFALIGDGAHAAKASFASAVAVLRSDLEELKHLIDDNSKSALLEAAELVNAHLDDMRELLDEHERFRSDNLGDPEFSRLEHNALTLTAELSDAIGDVSLWLTGRANEVMRGGLPIDRADLREFVTKQSPAELEALLVGLAGRPAYVLWISASQAFSYFVEKSGLNRPIPPPLPEPMILTRLEPLAGADPTSRLAEELQELQMPTSAADFIVRCDWQTSVSRHNSFIDAYSRRGHDLPKLDLSTEIEQPRRAGVARISKTTIGATS
jgi:hypothetical protein